MINDILLNIQKTCKNSLFLPKKSSFKKWIKAAFIHKRKKNTTIITIRIVDEMEIKNLNSIYRKKNQPTNILSFQYNQCIQKKYYLLGDLILCKNIIEKESIKYKKKLESYWAHMIIHGTLHLLGYDHKRKKDQKNMEEIENKIMCSLNYSKPYILEEDLS